MLVSRRYPRARAVVMIIMLLIVAIVSWAWTQRRQLASDYVDRELERRGVPAAYTISEFGVTSQRLTGLVIGDLRNPDLTAETVEIELDFGFGLPEIGKITARGVRMRGRLVDGRVTLGAVDRLLPPPTGAPFRLPDQEVDVADAALLLETPAGPLALALAGAGNLAEGFQGEVAVRAPRLAAAGCAVEGLRGYGALAVSARRPSVDGPVSASRIACEGMVARDAVAGLDIALSEGFDRWIGGANVRTAAVAAGAARAESLRGTLTFAGNNATTKGAIDLAATGLAVGGVRAPRVTIAGGYVVEGGTGRLSFAGDASARGVVIGDVALRPVTASLAGASGTPIGPIADALAAAVRRAGQGIDASGRLLVVNAPGGGAVRIERLAATSRSGATAAIASGRGFTYYWPAGLSQIDGEFALSGGGFPATRVSLSQARPGAPLSGQARAAPMAVGQSRLALAPIRFAADGRGGTRVETDARLDGDFSGGRVEGLALPIRGRFDPAGFAFGEGCTPVAFSRLLVSGLRLGATRMTLCPYDRALIWSRGGRLGGGAEWRQPRLVGTLGQTPIQVAAARARVSPDGFTAADVAARLGREGAVNRLDLAVIDGRFVGGGVAGGFSGADGKLSAVPLLLSDGAGRWRLAGGDLAVDAAATILDAADLPRFHPLRTEDLKLTLRNNRVAASGWLQHPETGTRVTRATIDHQLASGVGRATLDVPGIDFTEDFQPDQLTRLTVGVIALVRGRLEGRGDIAWAPSGVTSTGRFTTRDADFAAAFGPVTDLATTIEFTDLLALTSAPGQIATIGRVQTGIDVFDGLIRYQTLPGQRVRVEGGRWPFAGGELTLDETVLDFSQPSEKRLTFRVEGLDAATFVSRFEFQNIAATGTFDGVIPMVFDDGGGRIVDGRLGARAGGGTLSYIGELSDKNLGAYGKLAFDALKSLSYSKLDIDLDGSLDGEFVAAIDLDGVARDPALTTVAGGGFSGFLVSRAINQLSRIPFEFNITIRGPFRSLLATARSLEDPSLLIQDALPPELRAPDPLAVQTEESETVQ